MQLHPDPHPPPPQKKDIHINITKSKDSIVSTVTRQWSGKSRVQLLAETTGLSVMQNSQTSSTAHPITYPMGIRLFFPRGNAARAVS